MKDIIPDWIDERIKFDPSRDVQDSHIIRVFLDAERPYLSRKQVERGIGLSSQGTRDRLLELEEGGILSSEAAGGGRIYWINTDKSAWPIPPDVEVEPLQNELTVSELLNRQPIQLVGIGILVMIGGALFTTLFTLALAYDVSIAFVEPGQLLLWAILSVFVGISFCIAGVAVWLLERARTRSRNRSEEPIN